MTVLIVRHAEAESRSSWDAPDVLRPLSAKGRRQAAGLIHVLGDQFPIGRLVSSPSLRCIETVTPLAATLCLDIEVAGSLLEGVDPAPAIDLARSGANLPNGEGTLVLCSHGDLIPEILDAVRLADEVDLGPHPRCQKGSTWVLEGKRGRFTTAAYIPPP